MNTSTYYDLNLVEGTDKVNPLIVDVPNYEKIDEVMHDNEVASVGLATELTSGSVHSLTRQTPDASMFRFVATANYTAGDTFTVDGIQVTALTPSGEALGSGAYVINSNVLCCLVGSLLTIFTTGGTVTLAEDSEKLGGNTPDYYATAQGLTEARSVADAAGVLANSAITSATEALSKSTHVTLWSNPNPASPFEGQTITLNESMDNYAYYEVVFRAVSNGEYATTSGIVPKNYGTEMTSATEGYVTRRFVEPPSGNQIHIAQGMRLLTYGSNTWQSLNTLLIPVTVFGYK